MIDFEKYETDGKLTLKKMGTSIDDPDFLKDVLTRLSICNANALTINGVRCLFSGVTKERAFDKMFRSAMQSMDLDVFGFFISGLPVEAQLELRQKFEEEFGNIPLPWEEDYESGVSGDDNQYKTYLSSKNTAEKNTLRQEKRDLKSQIRDLEKTIGKENFNKINQINDFLKSDLSIVPPMLIDSAKEDLEAIMDTPSYVEFSKKTEKLEEVESQLAALSTDIGTVEDLKSLSDEEKIQLIEEQNKNQGTFGSALANVQEEVVNAYIEYIFDVMDIEQIGDSLSQVPGGSLVFNTLDQIFKCSTQGLFNPPIPRFLSSFSLDVCGPTRHVGIAIPEKLKEIPEIPSFSKAFFIQKLKNLFIMKMETVITKVITMLLLKLFETIDNALCKSLNAVGQAAIGTLTGGPGAGLDEAFADAFCPDADEDELNNVKKNAFGNALGKGAAPDSAYDCLVKAVNGT